MSDETVPQEGRLRLYDLVRAAQMHGYTFGHDIKSIIHSNKEPFTQKWLCVTCMKQIGKVRMEWDHEKNDIKITVTLDD